MSRDITRAEGVGFEPTMRLAPHSGFQDRRHRPLGEPSADNDSAVTVEVTQRSSRARREVVLRGEPVPGPGGQGPPDRRARLTPQARDPPAHAPGSRGAARTVP
jgi:hypothetical protein